MDISLLLIDNVKIACGFQKAAKRASTEEDFKVNAVKVLRDEVLDKFDLPWGKFEKGVLISGQHGRADVLYGHLFIEFEKPGVLAHKRGFDHAIDQLRKYIIGDAKKEKGFSKYFGVALDGERIGFIRYNEKGESWIPQGPFEVNSETIIRFLEALRGLYKKPLDAEYLIKDFGPESDATKSAIKSLYEKLKTAKSERTKTLFNDWKRVFSQVCAYSPDKIKGLENIYGLPENTDPDSLLFTVHTYYALIMKLIAAEVAVLFGEPYMQSYIRKLEDAYLKGHAELKRELDELEEGGIFSKIGISNFLESDYFSWYLNEWNEETSQEVIKVVKELSNYEIGTVELEPERIQDLFKRLYQYLVPKDIRHGLGEYYTPDWLAELLLDEIKYDGNPEHRLLDPACGSGTFLVLAIKQARKYRDEHFLDIGDTLNKITNNIVGYDLNPLAVLASRTNYLIAIGDYIKQRKTEKIRIPVFLADSIMVERRKNLYEEVFILKTVAGEFHIPVSIAEKGLLNNILTTIEECVKNKFDEKDLEARLKRETRELVDREMEIIINLFKQLAELEKKDKNRIWVRVLKNSFAPIFEGKFDYVVGNPPWINWESLPLSYREVTKILWESYGLIEKAPGGGMGKIRRDIASLFVVRSFDKYLMDDGILGFLIPFNILKTQGGSGFRRYLYYRSEVVKTHELSELYPFEGAINRTGILIIKKGKSKFPIPCETWQYEKTNGMDQEAELNEVFNTTKRFAMSLYSIEKHAPESPWMLCTERSYEGIKKIIKKSDYKGHEGVNTALNGVYWLNIISPQPKGVLVENIFEGKKTVKKIIDTLENDHVYPLLRGRDVKRWETNSVLYILVPHDDKTGKPIDEHALKVNTPKTHAFLYKFKKDLEGRSLYKLWGKNDPFYALYGIGAYSFSRYKVVWKDISGKISAKGDFGGAAVVKITDDQYFGLKPIIPDTTIMSIECNGEDEAYYISAIMNSIYTRFIAMGYSVLHVRTHILKYIGIEKYDLNNSNHINLSFLAKEAHDLAKEAKRAELKKVEKDIDTLIAKMHDISEKEAKEIKKILKDFH